MKKIILSTLAIFPILFSSCSHEITPNEEVYNFISNFGSDTISPLNDSTIVVAKINEWKNKYKNVSFKQEIYSDGILSVKKINFSLSEKSFIKIRFYFLGKLLLKIKAIPSIGHENEAILWDSLIAHQNRIYPKISDNSWKLNKKYTTSKVIYEKGYSNLGNNNFDDRPEENGNYFEVSYDLETAYSFYSQKINPYLSNNKSENLFYLDFKTGTVKVPAGKVWVIRKSENYVATDMEFGIFDTTKTCHCFLKGGLESTTFLMINGECIRLGTLSPGYDRSIFTQGTDICIPNAEPLLNKDNGKKQYLYYNQVFIQEFNMKDIPNLVDLCEDVKSMGFNENEFLYIKYLNYFTAIEKPKNPFE